MTEERYETTYDNTIVQEPLGDQALQGEQRDPEAERIVTEIEETRSGMSHTIDEIGHRLQPQTIASEVSDKIREATVGKVERMVDDAGYTAQQTGTTLMETVKQNPVPAALAGIGIGWLVLRMREQGSRTGGNGGNGSRYYRDGYGYGTGDRYAYGYGYQGGSAGGGQDPAERVRSAADSAVGKAQDVGANAQQAVESLAGTAQQTVGDAQWQAQRVASDAQRQFDRTLNENPLAMGALALGVGAAVALALPSTRKEQELMGEQRDKLVEKASEVASGALDEVQTRAQDLSQQVQSQGGNGQSFEQGQSYDESEQTDYQRSQSEI